ncbi:neuropilin-1a-like isoform X1 [Actinia tenebrosa]|uniref:Neuropilin-1a-like isoform X1 n=1 Tax=Actinia tenebrosa TaxID=6105 RepID=A0A6P8H671_ACTTE|nr:neuropilin-1a-like isoform X1 [Actinia tenebrosa]XP_031551890.1 neuropilin-1a-like isoform X1 [Actinia tenebrosa]
MHFFLILFITGLSTLVKGDGGCKVLGFLDCEKNKTFTGHLIRSLRILAPGLEDCQNKCYLEDKRMSYNLSPVEGMARTCELNDADHVSDPDHLVSKKDFEYCPIKNPCSSSPCPSYQWCAPDFYRDTFKCSYGRLTQWGPWSTCRCPIVRYHGCITPMNTSAPLLCEGSKMEEEKKCKSVTDISGCSAPLGMQDGKIKDNQISASSKHSRNCNPSYGRLYKTPKSNWDGGWCAKHKRIGEYMQIDLGTMKWVTKIATQGRNIRSYSQWVKEYTLSFTNNTITWQDYRGDENCTKRFIGNTDRNTVVTHELPVPVKTRYVRILPQAWSRHISMRMELYGCASV